MYSCYQPRWRRQETNKIVQGSWEQQPGYESELAETEGCEVLENLCSLLRCQEREQFIGHEHRAIATLKIKKREKR